MTRALHLVVLLALVGCRHQGPPDPPAMDAPDSAVVFTRDGFPFTPWTLPVCGTIEQPATGDLVLVDGVIMTIDPEREQRFLAPPEVDGRVLLRSTTRSPRIVGVRVVYQGEGNQRRLLNPLDGMTIEELSGLRGVWLEEWNDAIAASLGSIDPANCCVTIAWSLTLRNPGVVGRLPRSLRHFRIEPDTMPGVQVERWSPRPTVDAREIAALPQLRTLCLMGGEVENVEALGSLEQLESLEFSPPFSVAGETYLSSLVHLRNLDLGGAVLSDVTALTSMPRLAFLNANVALRPASDLALPALREIRASRSDSPNDIERFQRRHPNCTVLSTGEEALWHMAGQATRMRIRSGGTCHREPRTESTLYETSDLSAIHELLSRIHLVPSLAPKTVEGTTVIEVLACRCCGDPTIEFCRGERLVVSLGMHHGQSLRWPGDPLFGDAELETQSGESLARWLAQRGVPGPLRDRHQPQEDLPREPQSD